MNIPHDDELLDIVDADDHVIGQRLRSELYANKQSNFRVINAFIVNDKGQLWIPRRTADKRVYPLHLDVGVGGHVGAGETYQQAFAREVQEEINLNVEKHPYTDLGHFTPHQHNVSAFMHVYKITYNQTPPYNPHDFTEYYWLYPQEIIERITTGEKAKGDLSKLIKLLFL